VSLWNLAEFLSSKEASKDASEVDVPPYHILDDPICDFHP
jgi:hypothetical protein